MDGGRPAEGAQREKEYPLNLLERSLGLICGTEPGSVDCLFIIAPIFSGGSVGAIDAIPSQSVR